MSCFLKSIWQRLSAALLTGHTGAGEDSEKGPDEAVNPVYPAVKFSDASMSFGNFRQQRPKDNESSDQKKFMDLCNRGSVRRKGIICHDYSPSERITSK